MRHCLSLLALLSLAQVPISGQEHSRQLNSPDTSQIRSALLRVFDTTKTEDSTTFVRTLPKVEAAILSLLRHGAAPEAINSWLVSLPGYEGPHPEKSTKVGSVTFYQEMARDQPSYFLAGLSASLPLVLVLQMNYPWVNGPSRASLLHRSAGTWKTVLSLQSEKQLELYPIVASPERAYVAVFERYTRADGSEGTLRFWRLGASGPRRIPISLPVLQDASFACSSTSLTAQALQFPAEIESCTMCTRREIEVTLTPQGDHPGVSIRNLNPWVAMVDSFYVLLAAHDSARARSLLLEPGLYPELVGKSAQAVADTGDIAREGEVELYVDVDSSDYRYFRVISRADNGGRWRIAGLIKGVFHGGHIEWADGKP